MKREKTHTFTASNSDGKRVAQGDIVEGKMFPAGKPGGGGLPRYDRPDSEIPVDTMFKVWADYYTGLVNHFVPVLNGLQFDYELDPPSNERRFKEAIASFASELGAKEDNPLRWPLAGRYEFTRELKADKANTEVLTVFFECDPETSLVLNAAVRLRWDLVSSPATNISSSSSYLATSSSAYP